MGYAVADWAVEHEGTAFNRFFESLDEYQQAGLTAAIGRVLAEHGIDTCGGERGKAPKDSLPKFWVKKSLQAILESVGAAVPPGIQANAHRTVLLPAGGRRVWPPPGSGERRGRLRAGACAATKGASVYAGRALPPPGAYRPVGTARRI